MSLFLSTAITTDGPDGPRVTFWSRLRECLLYAFSTPTERQYYELCKTRKDLSDEEFLREFYPIGIDIAVIHGVRHVLAEQLSFDRVHPDDHVCQINQDVDLSEIVFELAEEFGLSIPDEEVAHLDDSVDALIRFIQSHVKNAATTTSPPTP
jgi:acyl carrier protein